MLDLNLLRENPDLAKEGIRKKRGNPELVDRARELDARQRELQRRVELLRAERNRLSRIEEQPDARALERGKRIKEELKNLEPELRAIEKQLDEVLVEIPNLPAPDVPEGKDESENAVVKTWGEPREFDFEPKPYWELDESLDIIDTERAAKVSGTRFGYLKRDAALLEFALVKLALEILIPEGFVPVVPPVMISDEAMRGMGYLEHGGEEETYHLEKDQLYLVGTSEQAIGPMHRDEVFDSTELPKRYVGFSTCFRREAGSYGKDTRGIFRVHQFDKVEMFSFTKPEESDREHELLLSLEEKLVQALKIPYQVTKMCAGDLGAPAARKYDINCWFPSEKRYRETHSTSNCTDFQARRLNIKYRDGDSTKFVHTLNGTAFAIGRTILAILENYQQADGSVEIPQVLRDFVGKDNILRSR